MGILNCKAMREKHIEKLRNREFEGKVAFIQVGDNPASNTYVRNKIKLCQELGIEVVHHTLSEFTSQKFLISIIEDMNNDEHIVGIMVQLPLPEHISEEAVINAIEPKKDIDGFTHVNKGKLMVGDPSGIVACTPQGIMTILNEINFDLKGKNVVIVGRSNIVGKPLAQLMINAGATVTVCNSSTNKTKLMCDIEASDLFISAIGKANYFNKDFFKLCNLKYVTAIDVGINRNSEGKLCGDIDKELYDEFKDVTSVPGGVGVMTVLEVIRNIFKCYDLQRA